jgi:hypothetical protein
LGNIDKEVDGEDEEGTKKVCSIFFNVIYFIMVLTSIALLVLYCWSIDEFPMNEEVYPHLGCKGRKKCAFVNMEGSNINGENLQFLGMTFNQNLGIYGLENKAIGCVKSQFFQYTQKDKITTKVGQLE